MPDPSAATVEAVLHAVRDAARAAAAMQEPSAVLRVAVALSGGRDSMVLLDALARLAPELRLSLSAAHVHHGLSARADAWAEFCAAECAARGVPLSVHRVRVARTGGESLEATARAARYAALATVDADCVALAHHADDQAETLLLQLLRGSGPAGLAGMPTHRSPGAGPALLRPFLSLPRAAIDAYARATHLAWVDDESNADIGVKRNFIRREIAPRLLAAFPGYPATLARAAAHQAEAARLEDDLAQIDATDAIGSDADTGATLDRDALIALSGRAPHRGRNLLRWFLRQHGLAAPSTARLGEMLDQLTRAPADARVLLAHAGVEIGFHRGRVIVHAPAVAPFAIAWRGETELALPHGSLEFANCVGAGIARAALEADAVTVRSRIGGERLQPAAGRPARALKRLLQEAAMPVWQRESLPLVFCGGMLAAVPGIGVDVAFQTATGASGYEIRWRRGARRSGGA